MHLQPTETENIFKPSKKEKNSKKSKGSRRNTKRNGFKKERKLSSTSLSTEEECEFPSALRTIGRYGTNAGNALRVNPAKRVSYGEIEVHEMGRCLGWEVVPSDGGYPLGLTNECVHSYTQPIETKEEWMCARAEEGPRSVDRATRYSEAQRKVLLLPALDDHYSSKELEQEKVQHEKTILCTAKNPKCSKKASAKIQAKEAKSNVAAHYHNAGIEHDCDFLGKELELLRASRGDVGCHCHKLKTLSSFDPEKNYCGKQINKLISDRKLRDELRKRHLLTPEEASCSISSRIRIEQKVQMMARLQDAINKERSCETEDCTCAVNGIECHADVCQCCRSMTPSKASECCGNDHGVLTVDIEAIRAHQKEMVKSLS